MKGTTFLLSICILAATAVLEDTALSAQESEAEETSLATDHRIPIFEVTITNITQGQTFSPVLVATHKPGVRLFELAQPASPELEALAETGDSRPLAMQLKGHPKVLHVASAKSLLPPGESLTVRVRRADGFNRVSLAAMLIQTNDGFFALNGARSPAGRKLHSIRFAPAYDAGTEINDELCASVPGPPCEGNGGEDEEGVIHIHSGIHDIGDLQPTERDWKNPVVRVQIRRRLVDPASLENALQ